MLIANVSQDAGGWDSPHLTQTTRTRDIWSGHVAWAPASAGAAAGTPGGESPFPPPPAPGAQSQVEVFLSPSIAWAGHPTWSSLILGNEPYPLRMAPRSPFLVGGEASAIQGVDFCGCGRIAPGNQLRDNIVWISGSQTRPLPLKNSCNMYILIWVYFTQTLFSYVFSPLHAAYYMSLVFSCK